MDKFVIIKCINPGFIPPKEEKKEEPKKEESKKEESKKEESKKEESKKEEPKKEEPKKVEIKSEPKKKRAAKSKPTNNTTTSSTTTTTTTTTTNNNNESTKTGLAAIITPVTEIKKQPQQTLVSHFFSANTGDKPSYKFLFEKEAADRAEEERKRAERMAKEEAILAEKRKQIQKAKLEAKKKREIERRKREEEEWEEYLAMQEKTTKGVEIIPHLYLGSFLAAKNSEWLLEANVTKIVNVTSEVPSYFLSKKEKENDKVISEKDEIDSFIVDDDEDDEEDEDIDDEDDENDEEDKEDEEDEDGNEDEDENVDIGDEKDKEMKDLPITPSPNEKKEENIEMKDNDDKDQEMKDLPVAAAAAAAATSSTNEKKEENVEMKDELTINNIPIKIDQVNEDVDSEKIKELSIKYLRISISDSFRSKIENYFQEAIDFINQGNVDGSEKSNVLIHCKQGRSRSPSIVIAYLMSNEKWTLEKAFNHVSSVSPKNLTVNDGFKKKLMDLEMELFGSNSINFFDRSNRTSRANISSAAITSTLNISQKRIKNQNKKNDDITNNNDDNDNDNEDNKNKNEENIVDTAAVVLPTNLKVEDDASTIDQLKVVKRRKNISIVEDDE
ncbi:hypothetical protein ACTFIW_007088 [Dictyostelium discoideum]